jgi:hypothetical protein
LFLDSRGREPRVFERRFYQNANSTELGRLTRDVGIDRRMDFEILLSRIALALGIGLLIGLERRWQRAKPSLAAGLLAFAPLQSPGCSGE